MDVSVSIPDDVARRLQEEWQDVPRRALEALAVDAYRSGVLTPAEVQRMLALPSRWATEDFLKQAGATLDYTEDDLDSDIAAIRRVSAR